MSLMPLVRLRCNVLASRNKRPSCPSERHSLKSYLSGRTAPRLNHLGRDLDLVIRGRASG